MEGFVVRSAGVDAGSCPAGVAGPGAPGGWRAARGARARWAWPWALCLLWLAPAAAADLRIVAPVERQVIQRRERAGGVIPVVVAGDLDAGTLVEARVVAGPDRSDGWHPLARDAGRFVGAIPAPAGGWHALEVRRAGSAAADAVVTRVGVGEIFVVAGQSNSANHGEARLVPASDLVSSLAPDGTWRHAADPQPGASGDGGSFLPPLGDLLVARFGVPVGFVSCGIGATSVREWLPAGVPFPNPPTLEGRVRRRADGGWESDGAAFAMLVERMRGVGPEGFRAVLWHQGESDANQADPTRTLAGPLYEACLARVIRDSRAALGRDDAWFVARATYHVPGDEASPSIRAAQGAVCRDRIALSGPDTDALGAGSRDGGGKGVHFSAAGLVRHAEAWCDSIAPWLEERLGERPGER
ncbi:MAG: sialate O-acetylesterase [Planctomycetaceae bacterium]